MKKLNKKYIFIFMIIFTAVLIGGIFCFFNTTKIGCGRLTDDELKTIDHFDLFSYKTLTEEILKEKHFVIDEEQTREIPNSTAYTYKSLADEGVDESGVEYCTVSVSDKGKIKKCNLYYSFTDINDENLELLVNTYCKAAGKKSFTASYSLPQKNQKVSFKQIVDLPLPGSDESRQKDLSSQNHSSVRYDLYQHKGNDSIALIMYVYDTVKLNYSFLCICEKNLFSAT